MLALCHSFVCNYIAEVNCGNIEWADSKIDNVARWHVCVISAAKVLLKSADRPRFPLPRDRPWLLEPRLRIDVSERPLVFGYVETYLLTSSFNILFFSLSAPPYLSHPHIHWQHALFKLGGFPSVFAQQLGSSYDSHRKFQRSHYQQYPRYRHLHWWRIDRPRPLRQSHMDWPCSVHAICEDFLASIWGGIAPEGRRRHRMGGWERRRTSTIEHRRYCMVSPGGWTLARSWYKELHDAFSGCSWSHGVVGRSSRFGIQASSHCTADNQALAA